MDAHLKLPRAFAKMRKTETAVGFPRRVLIPQATKRPAAGSPAAGADDPILGDLELEDQRPGGPATGGASDQGDQRPGGPATKGPGGPDHGS